MRRWGESESGKVCSRGGISAPRLFARVAPRRLELPTPSGEEVKLNWKLFSLNLSSQTHILTFRYNRCFKSLLPCPVSSVQWWLIVYPDIPHHKMKKNLTSLLLSPSTRSRCSPAPHSIRVTRSINCRGSTSRVRQQYYCASVNSRPTRIKVSKLDQNLYLLREIRVKRKK